MKSLSEQQAHSNIAAMLAAAAWAGQDYKVLNPSAITSITFGEMLFKSGRCDFVLLGGTGVVEEMEAVVTTNLLRATRMRQSILQNAFTGKLTR